MIDTVRFRQPRYLRDSQCRRNWHIEAVRREVRDSEGFEDEYLESYRGVHKKHGIKFFGNREQIITVEASLPRVLFGHNGKLLRSQAEIQTALRKLNRILDAISHPPESTPLYTRVDLVWHVPGSCKEFILAHRDVRHPRVRKATCTYTGQSIIWGGTSLRLMLYDKAQKELGEAGDFVRVEAQLREPMLDELFGDLGHELNFKRCYQYFRRLVLQLNPREIPDVSGIASLLAACLRMPSRDQEVNPAEIYLQKLCPRRRRDLQREIEAVSGNTRSVDWSVLLPEEPSPSPLELE